MKKLAATVIGGVLVSAVPAIADQANRAAPVRDGFLAIRGPKRLPARETLRVPIRCSVECRTKARTRLMLPGDDIPPSIANGRLAPRKPRNLVVTLNESATEMIQEHPNASRLRVGVSARSRDSDQRARAVKIFRFRSP